jgi:hypothetical protein
MLAKAPQMCLAGGQQSPTLAYFILHHSKIRKYLLSLSLSLCVCVPVYLRTYSISGATVPLISSNLRKNGNMYKFSVIILPGCNYMHYIRLICTDILIQEAGGSLVAWCSPD